MEWLHRQHRSGRSLWLCTAADESVASKVADHLHIFEGVLASNGQVNLSGLRKAAHLEQRFGYRGFDYCGNEPIDLHVWKRARWAIVIGDLRFAHDVAQHAVVVRTFPPETARLRALVRALRSHRWFKNLLSLAPLLTSDRADDPGSWMSALMAVAALCLCASAAYVINDLLDLPADRAHSEKSSRPFASGELSILAGVAAASALLAASFAIACFLPVEFVWALTAYVALAIGYSWLFKGRTLMHKLSLAGLYTVRIAAGAAAIG